MTGLKYSVTSANNTHTEIVLNGHLTHANCLLEVEQLIDRLKYSGCHLFLLDCNKVSRISPGGIIAIFQLIEKHCEIAIHLVSDKRRHHNIFRSFGVSEHFPVSEDRKTAFLNSRVITNFNSNASALIVVDESKEVRRDRWSHETAADSDIFGKSLLTRNLETLECFGVKHVIIVTREPNTAKRLIVSSRNLTRQCITVLVGSDAKILEILRGNVEIRLGALAADRMYVIPANTLLLPNQPRPFTQVIDSATLGAVTHVPKLSSNRNFDAEKSGLSASFFCDNALSQDILVSSTPLVIANTARDGGSAFMEKRQFPVNSFNLVESARSYAKVLRGLFAQRLFLDKFVQIREQLWAGKDVRIHSDVAASAVGVIGENTVISPSTSLLGVNLISRDCTFDHNTLLRDCCVAAGLHICKGDFFDNQFLFGDQTFSLEGSDIDEINTNSDYGIQSEERPYEQYSRLMKQKKSA